MIPIINSQGGGSGPHLNRRLADEPRLSKAQLDAMRKVAEQDGHAAVTGLDGRMRPVVHAQLPGPGGNAEYALLRNGEPTRITRPMAEVWQ